MRTFVNVKGFLCKSEADFLHRFYCTGCLSTEWTFSSYYWSLVEPSNFKTLVFILNLRLETNFPNLFCFGKMNDSWKNQVFPKLQFYYTNLVSKFSRSEFDVLSLYFWVFWCLSHLVQLWKIKWNEFC